MALVGSPDKPLGLVALKDLVEEITGDVVGL
jgi:CBS domain containing-hemolysin-like protein